jgi:hypothetical protein
MTYKIGRNDPCPCGSGKKYKQCCANNPADFVEPERKGHAGAVERAIDWLMNKHRKAFSVAMEERLFDELSPRGTGSPESSGRANVDQHSTQRHGMAAGRRRDSRPGPAQAGSGMSARSGRAAVHGRSASLDHAVG